MKIVVVGHVDHGKSSLIGRWFHDAGMLPEGRLEQLQAAAERRGVAFEFANLTDGLQAERDQNVTIDTAQARLRWREREIVFIDAPGHREFIKNMVTGAAQADAAMLVIDARDGISDQTRRHALLLDILGLTRIVVVINKIDLFDHAERRARFQTVSADAARLLSDLGLSAATIVPAAAVLGWNVVTPSPELSWHDGPTVADAVLALSDNAPTATDDADRAPIVFSVQDVYRRDARRVLVGRCESGTVVDGAAVVVLPSGAAATTDVWRSTNAALNAEGPCTALTVREPLFVSRGDVLASPDAGLLVAATFRARIFWLSRHALTPGRRYEVRLGTQHADAEIVSISRVMDASALVERDDRSRVPTHDVADIEVRVSRPLVIDPSGRARALSRLVIVDGGPVRDLAGGGIITGGTAVSATPSPTGTATRVTAEERHRRLGHGGAVVWLTGLSGAGKSTLADGLERALFDRGMQAIVLDGDRVRFGLNADLGFSAEDRRENIRRIAEVAKLFAETGVIAVTAFISPYAADRQRAREIIAGANSAGMPFIEVFVDADLSVCEARDPKGLYRKARAGEIAEFTGVSAPYEAPLSPEVVINTARVEAEHGVDRLLEAVLEAVRR